MDDEQPPRRKPGRPRVREEAGFPAAYVGFRASRSLKENLEKAAAESGRSLSTEAQFRLERSFHDAELGAAVFGDSERFGLLAAIDRLILAIEMKTGKSIEDRAARHLMADSISGFLKNDLEFLPALTGRKLTIGEARSLADNYALVALAALRGLPVVKPADPAAADAAAEEAAAAAAEFVARFPGHPFSRLARLAGEAEKPADEAA